MTADDPTEVYRAMPRSFRSPDADDWTARSEIARAADRVIGQARLAWARHGDDQELVGLGRALDDFDAAVRKAGMNNRRGR